LANLRNYRTIGYRIKARIYRNIGYRTQKKLLVAHPWKLVAKFAADVIDAGGKFLLRVSLIPTAILLPVSLVPVVHLDLRISLRIFEKIRNGPTGILWGWEETVS
jgi:hypothetical protein